MMASKTENRFATGFQQLKTSLPKTTIDTPIWHYMNRIIAMLFISLATAELIIPTEMSSFGVGTNPPGAWSALLQILVLGLIALSAIPQTDAQST